MRHRSKALAATVCAAVLSLTVPAFAHSVDDLDGPRGLATGPGGRIAWAEADGTVKMMDKQGAIEVLGQASGGFLAPSVDVGGLGEVWVMTAGFGPGSSMLHRWTPGEGMQVVADIGSYQAAHPDPNDLEDFPEDSNPYGVAALPGGGALVSDAGHNDVLKVTHDGTITLVARLLPRVVEMPEGYPDSIELEGEVIELPPAGTPVPSEAVATSVTIGKDGYYYVGELRGFPATPGTSQIWRIAPGTTNAECDPENPDVGPCQRFADGLTSVVDLAPAKDGGIYALELVQESWAAWEFLGAPPIGGLFKVPAGGGSAAEVDTGGPLILPGGVDTEVNGKVWLSGPIFGPGTVHHLD